MKLNQILTAEDEIVSVENKLIWLTKFWTQDQWNKYLSQFETLQSEEEIYVGSSSELEDYVARKSSRGFTQHAFDEDEF